MTTLIAGIVAVCILLLVLGFLVPRLSRGSQRGVDATLGGGPARRWQGAGADRQALLEVLPSSRKATNKSAGAGRKGRGKLPL